MFLVVKNGQYLRLEGVFEYPRWMDDSSFGTLLPRSKASTYAGIFDAETVAVQ